MKTNQIKSLLGLALILILAVLLDLAFKDTRSQFMQTFDRQLLYTMFEVRALGLVILYVAIFIVGLPLITTDYTSRLPTWIIIVVGLVILVPLTFLYRGQSGFAGYLRRQLDPFAVSHVGATLHFGAILTALGFYRLGRSFLPKKRE